MKTSSLGALLSLVTSLQAQELVKPLDIPAGDFRGIHIEIDSGSLVAKAADVPRLTGEVRYSPPSGSKQDIHPLARVDGSTLLIRGFPDAAGIPVHVSLLVPKGISLSVSGHALSVQAEGFESALKIRNFSGEVEIVNASGSTAVDSNSGNIVADLRVQPTDDLHLQTDSGTVKCTLDNGLSLKAVIRSAGRISWGSGAETMRGSLERTLGNGGPLFYASSRSNTVAVHLAPTRLAASGSGADVVFRTDTNWVYMNVVVKDLKGQNISDLTQEKFTVTDNGSPVQLGHFEKTTEPFHMLLLFDVSASITSHAALIRAAATQFIRRVRTGDELAVATFSSTPRLVQRFTADPALAEKALSALVPAGGTAIYDAVQTSISEYMREVAGRKAIVLFTDGIDNSLFGRDLGSSHSFEALLKSVKNSDCLIYPIFVQPVPDRRSQTASKPNAPPTNLGELLAKANGPDPKLYCVSETNSARAAPCPFDPYQIIAAGKQHLQQLAEETGGRFNGLREISSLADTYIQIASDLTTVYTIGFPVKFIDTNQWHPLKVRIRDAPLGTQTRTRSGYYSPAAKP